MPGVPLQLPAASVGVCVCMCVRSDYLRSALHAQGAHLVHAQVTHVHALVGDLNGAALEVLLVEDGHLDRGGGGGLSNTKFRWFWFCGYGFCCCALASVCPLYLGLHADVRHLVLSGLPVSLGSRLGFLSGHD